jgi:formate hydrogenlyase subunit 3/multisubunit Na+/H+ antiporter MnhD subunit
MLVLRRRHGLAAWTFGVLVGAGCALAVVPAIQVLAGGAAPEIHVPAAIPGGDWVFGVDPLSAFFLLLVLLVGGASALYGLEYLAPDAEHRPVAATHLLTAFEIAALALVVTARSAMPFLMAWEVMAVLAYFLVAFDSQRADVRSAGLIYLIGTHTGTLALIALFAFWGQLAGALSFDALAAAAPQLPAGGAQILTRALVGFGFKAGRVPLHVWLPGAHVRPAHFRLDVRGRHQDGIYGLLRTVSLVGPSPAWWAG